MLAHTDYHFSAWDGQRLVGFARVLTDGVYRATLWDVVVHPDYQGRGVGEELVNRVLTHPVLSTVEKFWLNTRDKSAFYEKFGFVRSDQGMVRDHHP
jgi:ribosomal protein S18 acetylase RimI-like enzyme